MSAQAERRRYRRVNREFDVRLAREIKDNEFKDMAIDLAHSINLSANGILVHVREPLRLREIVRVTFLKPDTFEFFEGLARVVRVHKRGDNSYEAGLCFFNLSTTEMMRLDYYIQMCAKKK